MYSRIAIFLYGILINCSLYGQSAGGTLIFHSGFEPGSNVVSKGDDADITGTDRLFKDHNYRIADPDNNPNIGYFDLQYQSGDSAMRYARRIPEPGNPSNHVLQFWLGAPNVEGKKGRIQGNLYGNNGLFEFSQSVRMYLTADFNTFKKFPGKIHWLTIAKFWNNITWSQSVPYHFRITPGIGKNTDSEGNLNFILDAEDCQLFENGRQKYTTVWAVSNEEINIPVSKWLTLELCYKEGNNETGRFRLAMTPEGGSRQVVFDLKRISHNTADPSPNGVGDFNPFKLYASRNSLILCMDREKLLRSCGMTIPSGKTGCLSEILVNQTYKYEFLQNNHA